MAPFNKSTQQVSRITKMGDTIELTSTILNWDVSVDVRKKIHSFATFEPVVTSFTLDLSLIQKAYTNGVLPIIADISRLRSEGFTIIIVPPSGPQALDLFIHNGWMHYLDPLNYTEKNWQSLRSLPLQKFTNDEELNDAVNKAVVIAMEQLSMKKGIPEAFEWALNEVAGNVLVHSGTTEGFLQITLYPSKHQLVIGVCDSGIGIPQSIRSSFNVKTDQEALELAMRQGVTSNAENGQGNGLAGTVAIAEASSGTLHIASGNAYLSVVGSKVAYGDTFPPFHGTFVDIQFNTDVSVDLPKVLWGHEPVSYLELKYEDDMGDSVLILRDLASSFGNRITGAKIRNMIRNLLEAHPGRPVRVVMTDVGIIASSFADEVFGKLMVELGPIDFGRFIKLEGVNATCSSIINRTIAQRLAQTINKES